MNIQIDQGIQSTITTSSARHQPETNGTGNTTPFFGIYRDLTSAEMDALLLEEEARRRTKEKDTEYSQ